MGLGWGWGGFGFRTVPSPTDFVNQHALARAAQGMQGPQGHNPYANNSNAYFNRVRDNGLVSHYDARRRRPPSYSSETPRRAGATAAPAAPAAEPVARVPLASFFDASRTLVWPNESPVDGGLKEKREISDQASLAVLDETVRQNFATLSSVTYARQKLIEYGQPALQEIQARATPVIADSFHRFMLSLYDALEQAAGPADRPGATAPKP
jgi:hypothetical protein